MAEKKSRGKLPWIVKIALVATVLVLGLTPLANAAIISFTITPDTCRSCEIATYTVEVESNTLWEWQNTTIPAGFRVVPPTSGGVETVRTDFWDDSGYVGFVTFTANAANPTTKVDVFAQIGSDTMSNTQDITYVPGDTFTITSPWGGAQMFVVRWPTDTEDGFANVSVPGLPLQNIMDQYTFGLCCPQPGAEFYFTATAEGDLEGMSDSVVCSSAPAAVPVYNTLGLAALVGIMSVVLGFATVRSKR